MASGKRGGVAANLTGIKCLPLMPIEPEVAETINVDLPYELKETYVDGTLDIVEGDQFIVNSIEYAVRAVGEWPWRGATYLRLFCEEIKGKATV